MPYVARPSWLSGGPDQAEQKPSSSVGASPTPGAAEATPPGAAPAAGALPGVQGTGFVNLSQYLQEGRGQAADYASKNIVAPMNEQARGVAGDATTQANRYAYWDQQQKARTDAEKANEGADPKALNPAWENYQGSGQTYQAMADVQGGLVGKAGADRFRNWQATNPEPEKYLGVQPLPGVPDEPMPDASLAGRASAVGADRRASGSMAGRGSLFARQAGQGYGYGNFDSFLSGGKPWAGVQGNYPTLWQQIKGNPGVANRHGEMPDTTASVPGTGSYAVKGAQERPEQEPRQASPPGGQPTNPYAYRPRTGRR